MPLDRKLFAIVVWIGVVANWSFGIWAVLFDPHALLVTFGLGDVQSPLWLYNYSILLMILSLFYLRNRLGRREWNARGAFEARSVARPGSRRRAQLLLSLAKIGELSHGATHSSARPR
jgi:hypothetical protein